MELDELLAMPLQDRFDRDLDEAVNTIIEYGGKPPIELVFGGTDGEGCPESFTTKSGHKILGKYSRYYHGYPYLSWLEDGVWCTWRRPGLTDVPFRLWGAKK